LFWPLVDWRLFQPAGDMFFNGGLKDRRDSAAQRACAEAAPAIDPGWLG
jgi:hypothetical protein